MKPKVRAVLKQWTPPALLRSLRRIGGGRFGSLDLRGEFSSWQDAAASSSGYDDPNILAKVANATRAVRDGHAAYERDSVVFAKAEPSWPVVSALLWAAAMSSGRLSVLDFGGSLGSTYFQHRGLLDDLEGMHWGIVEQPHFVQLGQREFQDTQLRFFNTIEECSAAIEPNAILLGSVLQYLNNPTEILRRLSATQARVLVVDRTPFADIREDRITVQRVPESIYRASYPFRILSRDSTLAVLTPTWQLVAPIEAPEGEIIVSSTLKFRFEGFILHR